MIASAEVVRQWVDAYVEGRDEDLVALTADDVVIRPRRGQGDHTYRGHDGVRRWLVSVGKPPPPFRTKVIETLDDARVVVEGAIEALEVVALFEVRDGKVASVSSYATDRTMLEHLGRI